MNTPQRIKLNREKGWHMRGCMKVDSSTAYGNPFLVGVNGNAKQVVQLYRHWMTGDARLNRTVGKPPDISLLRGKNLACWCEIGSPCHADVLLELANAEPAALQPSGASHAHQA